MEPGFHLLCSQHSSAVLVPGLNGHSVNVCRLSNLHTLIELLLKARNLQFTFVSVKRWKYIFVCVLSNLNVFLC